MIRSYAFSLHLYPVRNKMTDTQHIPIFQVCDSGESESKGIIADENVSQVCSTYESESESVIVN